MIEAKFFTVGTYLYKYNLTVLFVSPSKIAHDKFYIYCPPLLLNKMYAHGISLYGVLFFYLFIKFIECSAKYTYCSLPENKTLFILFVYCVYL